MGLSEPQVINLNKSRKRAIYRRQDKAGNWVNTTPLPADPASIQYYFSKGFKAPIQEAEAQPDNGTIKCPMCDFAAQSAFGLQSHLRKHITKSKKEETK